MMNPFPTCKASMRLCCISNVCGAQSDHFSIMSCSLPVFDTFEQFCFDPIPSIFPIFGFKIS